MAIQHLNLEEQEQLAKIKGFWAQYGRFILLVTILVLVIVCGWAGWQFWQNRQAADVSNLFDEFSQAVTSRDAAKAKEVITEIQSKYAKATPTPVVSLIGANFLIEMNDLGAAKEILSWVAEKGGDEGYKALASLRLADVLTNEKDYERALEVLSFKFPQEFVGLAEDRKGNVYYAQGKLDDAKASFINAFQALSGQSYQENVADKLVILGVDLKTLQEQERGQ